MTTAFGYIRTSSASNAGADKDSDKRQKHAIQSYADASGITIAGWYQDIQSGADAIFERDGFMSMLTAIAANGTKTIIVETANRFARDLMVAESGFAYLKAQGITIIAADSPTAFLDDSPTSVLVRQILASVSQFEKAMLVCKLKVARDRKKAATGRCSGRKPVPDAVKTLARELQAQGLSGRKIVAAMAEQGIVGSGGRAYALRSIQLMLQGA
jgi:DNA invertase Pin-like site-specific DNA recombinase